MKEKLLTLLLVFTSFLSFSQTNKVIKGNIKSENFDLKGIEVINQTTHEITVSDNFGNFSITGKDKDVLVFYGSEYISSSLTLNAKIISESEIKVSLEKKAIQIEEVIIEREDTWSAAYLQQIINKRYISDGQSAIKNQTIYAGSITDGMDIVAIGKKIGKLFKKKKEKEAMPALPFTDYVTASFNQQFFEETLKIKPDEMLLFLEFCEADPKSQTISETNNTLATMDFLILKNTEFQKINRILNAQKP